MRASPPAPEAREPGNGIGVAYYSRHIREAIRIPRRTVTTIRFVRTAWRSTRANSRGSPSSKGIYKPLATVVKIDVRFEPTFCIMATAAMEIKTAIRAYSIAAIL